MKFSIIIPAYNEEKNIGCCLISVFSQKEAPEYEVIVVDNASSDGTARVVQENFPLARLIYEPKKGVTLARNRGATLARGETLVFVDADVVLPLRHLKKIAAKFRNDGKLILVSGPHLYTIDSNFYIRFFLSFVYRFLASPAEYFFNRFLNLASSLNAGNFAVLKTHFQKVGGFNEKIAFFGDEADLSLKLRKLGKVRFFLDLGAASSARRFKKEGLLKLFLKYTLNVVWPVFFKKPFTKDYLDIR